jgi:hypothetical protein
VNHKVELTEEEKTEARKKAMEELTNEIKAKARKKPEPVKTTEEKEKPVTTEQSLF